MKRRLEIARGLLHRPRVLFLDEPTAGLDPQTRHAIWEHVRSLRDEAGITVFMTTHYMDEAENCDRIAVIDHGKIQALDTPEKLKRLVGGDKVVVTGDPALERDISARYRVAVQRVGTGPESHFQVSDGAEFVPRVAVDFRGRIRSIQVTPPSLDDVFLKLTGRIIREEEGTTLDWIAQIRKIWTGRLNRASLARHLHNLAPRVPGVPARRAGPRHDRPAADLPADPGPGDRQRHDAQPGARRQLPAVHVPGILGMSVLFTSMFSAVSIIWDREFGFLKEVLVAPVPRWAVAVGRVLGGADHRRVPVDDHGGGGAVRRDLSLAADGRGAAALLPDRRGHDEPGHCDRGADALRCRASR